MCKTGPKMVHYRAYTECDENTTMKRFTAKGILTLRVVDPCSVHCHNHCKYSRPFSPPRCIQTFLMLCWLASGKEIRKRTWYLWCVSCSIFRIRTETLTDFATGFLALCVNSVGVVHPDKFGKTHRGWWSRCMYTWHHPLYSTNSSNTTTQAERCSRLRSARISWDFRRLILLFRTGTRPSFSFTRHSMSIRKPPLGCCNYVRRKTGAEKFFFFVSQWKYSFY